LPERLGGRRVAALEGGEPVGDRAGGRHGFLAGVGTGTGRTGGHCTLPPRPATFFPAPGTISSPTGLYPMGGRAVGGAGAADARGGGAGGLGGGGPGGGGG